MHEGALPVENPRHECTQGLGADKDQRQENSDLQNSNASHRLLRSPLKLLRTEKRVDQINEQPQRRDSGNDVVHIPFGSYNLSQAFVKTQQTSRNAHPTAT